MLASQDAREDLAAAQMEVGAAAARAREAAEASSRAGDAEDMSQDLAERLAQAEAAAGSALAEAEAQVRAPPVLEAFAILPKEPLGRCSVQGLAGGCDPVCYDWPCHENHLRAGGNHKATRASLGA